MFIDRWMDKEVMVHIYNEYYSAIKKNEVMPFSETWMDLEIIILSEVSQRKTNIIWYHLYAESKIKWYIWNYLPNRNRLTHLENKLGGRVGGGVDWEFRVDMYKLHLKQITKDFPGDTMDRNPPANAGDMGSIPALGKFHMPQSMHHNHLNCAAEPVMKPTCLELMLCNKRSQDNEKATHLNRE